MSAREESESSEIVKQIHFGTRSYTPCCTCGASSRFHIDAVDVNDSRILTSTSEFNMMPNLWVSKKVPDHSLTSSRKVAVDVRKS